MSSCDNLKKKVSYNLIAESRSPLVVSEPCLLAIGLAGEEIEISYLSRVFVRTYDLVIKGHISLWVGAPSSLVVTVPYLMLIGL